MPFTASSSISHLTPRGNKMNKDITTETLLLSEDSSDTEDSTVGGEDPESEKLPVLRPEDDEEDEDGDGGGGAGDIVLDDLMLNYILDNNTKVVFLQNLSML